MKHFAAWGGTALLLALTTGCASSPQMLAENKRRDELHLLYRTESDRLNLSSGHAAGASAANGAVPASYIAPQASANVLPPVTVGALMIQYPHPQGIPDMARATAYFRPTGENGALANRSFASHFGLGDGEEAPSGPVVGAWTLDIPRWQADAIVAKLQKANFFQRSKVLDPEAYVGVQLGEDGFGKNYRAVPELDALLLRVRQQGRPAGQPGAASQVMRLPPGP